MSIPKVIHYCWFGKGEMPPLTKKCLKSWKKYCPDYKIICWNEENFDVSQNRYMCEAYEAKKWAFVSDYARLKIIYDQGGIYLDTDVELFKSLDLIRDNNAIVHQTGHGFHASGILGCEKFPKLYEVAYEKLSDKKAYYVLLNETAYEMFERCRKDAEKRYNRLVKLAEN